MLTEQTMSFEGAPEFGDSFVPSCTITFVGGRVTYGALIKNKINLFNKQNKLADMAENS